jgi:hypothetical protein
VGVKKGLTRIIYLLAIAGALAGFLAGGYAWHNIGNRKAKIESSRKNATKRYNQYQSAVEEAISGNGKLSSFLVRESLLDGLTRENVSN